VTAPTELSGPNTKDDDNDNNDGDDYSILSIRLLVYLHAYSTAEWQL
jgi:hypothetical protein